MFEEIVSELKYGSVWRYIDFFGSSASNNVAEIFNTPITNAPYPAGTCQLPIINTVGFIWTRGVVGSNVLSCRVRCGPSYTPTLWTAGRGYTSGTRKVWPFDLGWQQSAVPVACGPGNKPLL